MNTKQLILFCLSAFQAYMLGWSYRLHTPRFTNDPVGRLGINDNWVMLEPDDRVLGVTRDFLWEVVRFMVLCRVIKRLIGYLDGILVAFYWSLYVPYLRRCPLSIWRWITTPWKSAPEHPIFSPHTPAEEQNSNSEHLSDISSSNEPESRETLDQCSPKRPRATRRSSRIEAKRREANRRMERSTVEGRG